MVSREKNANVRNKATRRKNNHSFSRRDIREEALAGKLKSWRDTPFSQLPDYLATAERMLELADPNLGKLTKLIKTLENLIHQGSKGRRKKIAQAHPEVVLVLQRLRKKKLEIKQQKYKEAFFEEIRKPTLCEDCGTKVKAIRYRRGHGRGTFTQVEELICPRCGAVLRAR